ncbi:C39 family peptidase [Virgibacillus sp. 179-BFC.A HS]|uniref:C39 family peptidase n=2 Tax=Tigheibacillus jepli TaxID=3035914 RepID=A0ABU5CHH8_9BACI|nr:C39 family peptidase [Virgibacillus sp. 179-BFC.A HS]MDY0405282.1 C39 family peptidase [Virgibacillus sp. 179-BFC.A HS]
MRSYQPCHATFISRYTRRQNDTCPGSQKNPAKFKENDTGVYFGDPNNGFVGNMYTFSEPGYGVYHKPVAALAKKYAGDRVNDLSGKNFSEVLAKLNQNKPVWVIINATYKKLPKSEFITWQTKQGEIHITMREHSVLVTGYDDKYIYFNDPLNKHTRAPINDFILAWEQMGKQAIAL